MIPSPFRDGTELVPNLESVLLQQQSQLDRKVHFLVMFTLVGDVLANRRNQ